jgi:transposase
MKQPEHIDISTEELEALLGRVRSVLAEEDYQTLAAVIHTLGYVTKLLDNREATLDTLRRLLCRSSTEKTAQVLQQAGMEPSKEESEPSRERAAKESAGHGRNGAAAYRGATRVAVQHASLKAGDPCPDSLCGGKVYPLREPGVLVRIKGQAPLAATVYELEKLRCNLCGKVFTAEAPEEAGEKKYDETAAGMIALLRYGSGFPWYRLKGLEASLGIPLPVATQCEIVAEIAVTLRPALEELIHQAAHGGVMHNDDTSMRVLSLGQDRARDAEVAPVALNSNRYSVPVEWIGRRVEVRETRDKIEIQLDARRLVTHRRIAEAEHQRVMLAEHRPPRGHRDARPNPHPEEQAIVTAAPELAGYVAGLKQRSRKVVTLALRQLLRFVREYPREPLVGAVEEAARYGLYDLDRPERMILRRVTREYFLLDEGPNDD